MTTREAEDLRIRVEDDVVVSGLLLVPARATVCYVLAHGAGAGMRHPFMSAVADGLGARQIATVRFQFPYMERGSRRPDPPRLAYAAVRAAVSAARDRLPGLRLLAGGKSFGGRMTSQAQAGAPLPGVVGLAFLGWPLHPAGKPSVERAAHLSAIRIPMLFFQGTRDALADLDLMREVVGRLGSRATLVEVPEGDHSFHVPARSGRTDIEVLDRALDGLAAWADGLPNQAG